jgi:protein phosphatase
MYLEGYLTFEAIRTHPQRNLITSAVQQDSMRIDVYSRKVRLRHSDIFFICSDGVWECLEHYAMKEFLSARSLEESALALELNLRNASDNISFVLHQIEFDF